MGVWGGLVGSSVGGTVVIRLREQQPHNDEQISIWVSWASGGSSVDSLLLVCTTNANVPSAVLECHPHVVWVAPLVPVCGLLVICVITARLC